jgi:cation diffusion facilitator CzcD-associated flavoprotein CzcO
MAKHLPLLIVGAGPFGLAMSAYARRRNIEHMVVGQTMEFWKDNMPKGMYLRSACDWHLDPFDEDTIERYLETKSLRPADVEPLARDFYLDYCEWFRRRKGIEVLPARVRRLDCTGDAPPLFEAELEGDRPITARNVVLALGFRYFQNVPDPYPALFPAGRFAHTCDLVDFSPLKGKRVLIIGGRQSAFEWAALIHEQGADTVHLTYRHPTPSFEPSDWSWVRSRVDAMVADPGWFRRSTAEEKDTISRRMWAEGRLKLEPWLAARVASDRIRLFPNSHVTACTPLPGGELDVRLDNGSALAVDHVILATGYKVDVRRIPLLTNGNILARLESRNGFPALDEHFQSNVPGLYFTSMCAMQDFGPFFAFTVSVRASAKLIGAALAL